MNIFLTGGTGFIGSNLLRSLEGSSHNILAIKRQRANTRFDIFNNNLKWIDKSFEQISDNDFNNVEILVHLAAYSENMPHDNLSQSVYWNVVAPLEFFMKAYQSGVRKFLVTGTCFEYGMSCDEYEFIPTDAPLRPLGSYATSKAISSIAFKEFSRLPGVSLKYLRLFQVYGDGESENRLWPSLCKAAKDGQNFEMSSGVQVRDFINVRDVCEKLLFEIEDFAVDSLGYSVKNIGTGKGLKLIDFANYWWAEFNAKGQILVNVLPLRDAHIQRCVAKI